MNLRLSASRYIELNVQDIKNTDGKEIFISKKNEGSHRFVYCRNGEAKIHINENIYVLNEGDICYCSNRQDLLIEKGMYDCIVVAFDGAYIDDYIALSPFNTASVYHDEESNIGYTFYRLLRAKKEDSYLSIKCLGILYEIIYEFTKNAQEKDTSKSSQERHVEMAKGFIEQNYQNEISIQDVAKEVGVTSNYLANIFAKHLQTTPKQYLTQVRMEHAKRLLCTRQYKVKDVGELVGYKNQLHFSGEFKKYSGQSPLEFAKSN